MCKSLQGDVQDTFLNASDPLYDRSQNPLPCSRGYPIHLELCFQYSNVLQQRVHCSMCQGPLAPWQTNYTRGPLRSFKPFRRDCHRLYLHELIYICRGPFDSERFNFSMTLTMYYILPATGRPVYSSGLAAPVMNV